MFNFFKKLFKKIKKEKSYYEIKCPYTYYSREKSGALWIIYTQPIKKIIELYYIKKNWGKNLFPFLIVAVPLENY